MHLLFGGAIRVLETQVNRKNTAAFAFGKLGLTVKTLCKFTRNTRAFRKMRTDEPVRFSHRAEFRSLAKLVFFFKDRFAGGELLKIIHCTVEDFFRLPALINNLAAFEPLLESRC